MCSQAEITDAALVAVVPTTQYGYRQMKTEEMIEEETWVMAAD